MFTNRPSPSKDTRSSSHHSGSSSKSRADSDPTLSLYFSDISREALLSRDEEIALSRQIQLSNRAARLLTHSVPDVQRAAALHLTDALPTGTAAEVGALQQQLGDMGERIRAAWREVRAGVASAAEYASLLDQQARIFEERVSLGRPWRAYALAEASIAHARSLGGEAQRLISAGVDPAEIAAWEDEHHLPISRMVEIAGQIAEAAAVAGPSRERLIAANTRLVVAVARAHARGGHALADLISYGNEGLIRAVERYDGERGVPFASYAILWIRQAVTRGMLEQGLNVIRLPDHAIRALGSLERAARAREQEEGRGVEPADVAAELGWKEEGRWHLLFAPRRGISLDAPLGEDGGGSPVQLLAAPLQPLPGDSISAEIPRLVERFSRILDERQRSAVALMFGAALPGLPASIDPTEGPMTTVAAGAILDISGERVRQITEEVKHILACTLVLDHAGVAARHEGERALHPTEVLLVRHALNAGGRSVADLSRYGSVRAFEELVRRTSGSPEQRTYRLLQGAVERLAEQIVVDKLSLPERAVLLEGLREADRAFFSAYWLNPAPLFSRVAVVVGGSDRELAGIRAGLRERVFRGLIQADLRDYLPE